MDVAVDTVGVTSHKLGRRLAVLRQHRRCQLGISNGDGTDLLIFVRDPLSERMHRPSSSLLVGEEGVFPQENTGSVEWFGFELQLILWKTPHHRDADHREAEAFIEPSGADIVRGDP